MPSSLTVRMGGHGSLARPTAAAATASAILAGPYPKPSAGAATATGAANTAGSSTTATNLAPNVYGAGIVSDTKSNIRIGLSNNAKVAFRFRASQTSALSGLRVIYRKATSNTGYSKGSNISMTYTLQSDDGTVNHRPSGTVLATVTDLIASATDANTGVITPQITFSSPYTTTAGELYHLVVENTTTDKVNNYVSLNFIYSFTTPGTPRHPAFSDDFALMGTDPTESGASTSFTVMSKYIPVIDIIYANGSHDGQRYVQGDTASTSGYAVVSGTANMARERIIVSGGDKIVTGVYLRCSKVSGASDLVLTLQDSGGTTIDSVNVTASSVPTLAVPTEADTGEFVGGAFAAPRTLTNGSTYYLRASTASGTTYSVLAMLAEDATGTMGSWRFTDGAAQKTTNSGSAWTGIVSGGWQQNCQLYFTTTSGGNA